jgi:AcrR family transcriptional regulator
VVVAKRVRMTAQERREQLVGVARSLFAERGYEATSIEELAERAGVSKPVVYQHFGGKEGIYAVVVDREVQRLTDAITVAFDAEVPRLIAVRAAEAFLAYIEEHEEGFHVLVRDAPAGMTGGSLATVIATVAARCEQMLIDRFQDRGFTEESAPMYARMMVGAIAALGEWWLDVREPEREVVTAHVVNLLWNGLHNMESLPVDAKGLEKLEKRQRRARAKQAKEHRKAEEEQRKAAAKERKQERKAEEREEERKAEEREQERPDEEGEAEHPAEEREQEHPAEEPEAEPKAEVREQEHKADTHVAGSPT